MRADLGTGNVVMDFARGPALLPDLSALLGVATVSQPSGALNLYSGCLWIPDTIPVPASSPLMLAGFGVLAMVRRRGHLVSEPV